MKVSARTDDEFVADRRDKFFGYLIKRSRSKVPSKHCDLIRSELNQVLTQSKLGVAKQLIAREEVKRVSHNSEKMKKRLKLIEDYFYPEFTTKTIDPNEHTPILHTDSLDLARQGSEYKSSKTLKSLEGSMVLKEVETMSSGQILNCSIIQTIKKIIRINENDVVNFESWDKNTDTNYKDNIYNDIKRSRIRDSLDKDSMLEDLLLIITFYCENNSIVYQQGMQDIFIPFVYLKSCQFSIAEVYAYTKGYIDMFMPNTLHSKFNGKDYSLPHLQCQLSLLRMLLKYHDIELYQHFKKLEIDTEAFATSWILTQFSRVVEFSLIYELIEIILFEKDKLIVLFMSIALLKHFKSQILNLKEMEFLLPFLQKKARISNMRELCKIYYESVAIRSQTPLSFAILIQKLKINDAATVISNEEIVELQDLELETFIVYPEELLLNQRQIMNCSHLYNTSNNDKSMNRLYLTGNQNKYIMSDNEREGSLCKDFQSITSINMLKRDCGNDTEIGKSVNFKIIDLSSNKKFVKCCKELIICSKIKGKKTKDVLDSCYQELKKSNILIVTSSHKQKISDKEKIKFQETLEILASLGLSRVSVLKGGAKGYRMG